MGQELSDDTRPEVRMVREDLLTAQADLDEESARRRRLDEFMEQVHKRWRIMKDAEEPQRRRSIEEVEFNSGKHWDNMRRAEREDEDKVVIEINRTPQFLNQVANEERMTRPQIIIMPVGNGADEETAKVKQGIIRAFEHRSGAEGIRDDCFYSVLEKGWSYYRVREEYVSERSRKRTLRTARIANDFSVYCDPAAQEYDKSDAMDYIITEDLSRDQYVSSYPNSKLAGMSDFTSTGDKLKEWISDENYRIAEFWYKKRTREKVYFMADDPQGDGYFEDEVAAKLFNDIVAKDERGQPIWRWTTRTRVYWALVNAVEVLDGNDDLTGGREPVPGAKNIPIIPVHGRRVRVDDRYMYAGMVRDAIEPCLAADYWLSAITEMVALGQGAPWLIASESTEQYQDEWNVANVKNLSVLHWDAFTPDGKQLPAPSRDFGEPPINSMAFILKFADEDLKRVMGIYNAGLGAPGPETSGVAIGARQRESDIANFNYIDNLKRSIAYEAKIYLEYMPMVLDEEQVVQLVRPDGSMQTQVINKMFKDPKTGENKTFKMGVGDYDVNVEVGASFATRRQEAAAGLMEYFKIDPAAAALAGHILARNLDFPDKAELEKMLKSRVPPNLLENDGEATVPEAFKAQYGALAARLEETTGVLEEMAKKLESKELEFKQLEMKLASDERREAMRAEVKMTDIASKTDLKMLESSLQKLEADIAAFKEPGPVEYDFEFNDGGELVPAGGVTNEPVTATAT